MQTLGELARTPGASYAYFGDRGDWPIAASVHRESDMIERSNFEVIKSLLGYDGDDDDTVVIERSSHWAVGWVDYLLVNPSRTDLVAIAQECRQSIEDYPILYEMAYSEFTAERHYDQDCSNGCDECEYEREQERLHDMGRCLEECHICLSEDADDE